MEERKIKEARLAELKEQLLAVEGTPTEVYSRIVGYYRSVRNWNAGKRHEYTKRKTYQLEQETTLVQLDPTQISMNVAAVQASPVQFNFTETVPQSKSGIAEAYVLFTRDACPGCKPVKEYLQSSGLKATIIDVDTPDGLEAARQYNVMATPTAILFGKQGEERVRAYNRSQLAGFFGTNGNGPQLNAAF